MASWKKPTKDEIRTERVVIAQRAHDGDLRLPGAIVDIRKTYGVSQEKFAQIFKMTRRQIAEIETGIGNPTLETLNRIGKPFGFVVGLVPRAPRDGEYPPADQGSTKKARAVRVIIDPQIMSGDPCIEGTRVPVETVLANFREGHSAEAIYTTYPSLPVGAIEAAFEWERQNKPSRRG